ncbi:MAG TPA: hypothetical protein VHE55_06125 [Fimbriimonadaceae bacterium]|nr:hypothetical protein [Fimbriimonadaceae bacterium]
MKRTFRCKWLLVMVGLITSLNAYGQQLLIDPTGGNILFSDSSTHDLEVATGRSLGFTANFFGAPVTRVDVSTKGNLNFAADVDPTNTSMPDIFGVARMSPLWNDLLINSGDGGSVVEAKLPGVYYSVTWSGVEEYPESGGRQTFQVAWFGTDVVIRGFAFRKDDVAFSYAALGADFVVEAANGATVGLDKGDQSAFVPLPDTALGDGVVANDEKSLIPTAGGQFVLFRPDGAGSYVASIVSPVPEPSPAAALGLMTFGVSPAFRRWRRRSRRLAG